MKGQTPVFAGIGLVVVAAAMVLVGALVYGYVANVTPHDYAITNQSFCTTACAHSTSYQFSYSPILNDSSLVCINATNGVLTNGGGVGPSAQNSFNVIQGAITYLNLTNTTGTYRQVNCTYTYDWATNDQHFFWTQSLQMAGSGFVLLSVLVIVIAAGVIIGIVLMLRAD